MRKIGNKEGEQNHRGGYGKGSKRTRMRHNKFARDLEKEASKTYNIQALWQRSQDLGMSSIQNCRQIAVYLPFLYYPMFLPDVHLLPQNNKSMTINKSRQ